MIKAISPFESAQRSGLGRRSIRLPGERGEVDLLKPAIHVFEVSSQKGGELLEVELLQVVRIPLGELLCTSPIGCGDQQKPSWLEDPEDFSKERLLLFCRQVLDGLERRRDVEGFRREGQMIY